MENLDKRIARAVRHFWKTRTSQGQRQGSGGTRRDAGNRTRATGGKQLDGFNDLLCELLVEAGIPDDAIYRGGRADVTLPGFSVQPSNGTYWLWPADIC